MGRSRKPENETVQQVTERRMLESISNVCSRSEKTSWNRKMDNMVSLISALKPLESQIMELELQKHPILDDIAKLRAIMVSECVHPFAQLVVHDDAVLCKFCNNAIVLQNDKSKKST